MKKLVWLFIVFAILSCDDGNEDVPELVFPGSIELCDSFVLYKTSGNEALIVEISQFTNDDFFKTTRPTLRIPLNETGSNTVNYRTFDEDVTSSYFCQNIPPSSPNIVSEWPGTGTLEITTVLESTDDNDNVDETNSDLDTDGDTIPNYKDIDDDGDGILTIAEDLDGDGDPTNDDTDGDTIPNYLEEDDDNDGILTKYEDIDGSGSPNNDDDNGNDIPNYLDKEDAFMSNTPLPEVNNFYTNKYSSTLMIRLLELTNANSGSRNFDLFDFGTITENVIIPGNSETKKK